MAETKPSTTIAPPSVAELTRTAKGKTSFKAPKGLVGASLQEDTYKKILAWGPPGSGKTYLIVQMLLAGEKVFDCDTDFGGNGLATVSNTLKRMGREDLLANIGYFEFKDYETLDAFLDDPSILSPVPGVSWEEWQPTVMAWEGFSNWQANILDEYILDKDAWRGEKAGPVSDLRQEGLLAEQQDWGGIQRATLRAVHKFLAMRPAGKPVHKLMTALEGKTEENKISGETIKNIYMKGGARYIYSAGFDLIMFCQAKGGGKHEYQFASPAKLSKSRGFDVAPVETDFKTVWERIR